MIGSKLPKLKTALYESHFRHCVLHGKKETKKTKQQNVKGQQHKKVELFFAENF